MQLSAHVPLTVFGLGYSSPLNPFSSSPSLPLSFQSTSYKTSTQTASQGSKSILHSRLNSWYYSIFTPLILTRHPSAATFDPFQLRRYDPIHSLHAPYPPPTALPSRR